MHLRRDCMPIDKKSFIGANLRSEYDMWLQEFIRLNRILELLHENFYACANNPRAFKNIALLLREMYSFLQSVVTDRDKDQEVANFMKDAPGKLDKFLENAIKIEQKYSASVSSENDYRYVFPVEYYKELDGFRNMLLQIRQRAGMGIRVSRRSDPNERDENLLGIKARQ